MSAQPSKSAQSPIVEATPLLHNSGWAPRASISWHGFNRKKVMDKEVLIQEAKNKGTWLTCSFYVSATHSLYTKDWNNCCAILRVLEPEHTMNESQARIELLSRIDAHAKTLNWPAFLMTANDFKPSVGVELSHPLTTFVALTKSTGSVWMMDRQPRLAPLHNPVLLGRDGHTIMNDSTQWRAGLFFPKGLPSDLLQSVKGEYEQMLMDKRKAEHAAKKAAKRDDLLAAELAAELAAKNLPQVKIKRPGGYPR